MRDNVHNIRSLPFRFLYLLLFAALYFLLFVLDLSPLQGRPPGTIQIKSNQCLNLLSTNYLTRFLIACTRSFLILLNSCFVSSRWLSSIRFLDWFQRICFWWTSWPCLLMWSCSWWWWWRYFLFWRFPNVVCGWTPSSSCCCCCWFLALILLKKCLERCDIAPGT